MATTREEYRVSWYGDESGTDGSEIVSSLAKAEALEAEMRASGYDVEIEAVNDSLEAAGPAGRA